MTARGTKSGRKIQLALRLDPEDYHLLADAAVDRGVGVSTAARLLVKTWANRKREVNAAPQKEADA